MAGVPPCVKNQLTCKDLRAMCNLPGLCSVHADRNYDPDIFQSLGIGLQKQISACVVLIDCLILFAWGSQLLPCRRKLPIPIGRLGLPCHPCVLDTKRMDEQRIRLRGTLPFSDVCSRVNWLRHIDLCNVFCARRLLT